MESCVKKIKLFLLTLSFITLAFSGWSADIKTGINAIPAWCKLVFYIDVTKAMNHPFVSELLSQDKNYEKIKSELSQNGIDITQNNIHITIGSAEINGKQEPDFVMFVDLNYNESKLISFIKNKAKEKGEGELTLETIGGYSVLSSKKDKKRPKVAFLQGKSILIASQNKMKEALTYVQGSGKTVLDNQRLIPIINSLQKNNFFWGVMEATDNIKTQIKDSAKSGGKNPTLQKVVQASENWEALQLFSNIDPGINLNFGSVSTDSSSAQASKDAYNDIVMQGKMMLGMFLGPDMSKIISNNIAVVQKENSAYISISFTDEEIKLLTKLFSEINSKQKSTKAPAENR